jgi:hypothetical protein
MAAAAAATATATTNKQHKCEYKTTEKYTWIHCAAKLELLTV